MVRLPSVLVADHARRFAGERFVPARERHPLPRAERGVACHGVHFAEPAPERTRRLVTLHDAAGLHAIAAGAVVAPSAFAVLDGP